MVGYKPVIANICSEMPELDWKPEHSRLTMWERLSEEVKSAHISTFLAPN